MNNQRVWQRIPNLPLILGISALGSALFAQSALVRGNLLTAVVVFGVATLLSLLFRQPGPVLAVAQAPEMEERNRIWGWIGLVFGAAALAILALPQFEVEPPTISAWWLHLASIASFLIIVVLVDRFLLARHQEVMDCDGPWRVAEMVTLACILLFALFLRLYRFSDLPFGTWYDEAEIGLRALRVLAEPTYRPLYSDGPIHAPAHYLYLVTAAFRLFGVSTESIRAVSVAAGVGAVLAGYLAGRELFGQRMMGLVLAFVLAVASWSINFSRIGMYNMMTPLFELLAVGFLLRGFRRQRLYDYGLAGISLGLGLCFYSAFQLFLPVVGLFLLHCTMAIRDFLRNTWRGLLVMGLATLFVVGPIVLFAYRHPDIFFARAQEVYVLADRSPEQRLPLLLENARKHLLMFNLQGDPNGRHNLAGAPMLDPILAALMVVGVAFCLFRFSHPTSLLLLMWTGVMLLGGILSLEFEAPQSLRAIGAMPAAYILAVMPISLLWQTWRNARLGSRSVGSFVWPLLALLLAVGYLNYHNYFVERAKNFASWNAFSTPESIAAGILADEGDGADFYIISFFFDHPTIKFLARNAAAYKRLETTDHLPLLRSGDRDVVLIMNHESRSLYSEALRYYPDATFEAIRPPFGGPPVVYYVRLTADDMASVQGIIGTYYAGEGWAGKPLVECKESQLGARWPADAPVPIPFSVEWNGVLRVASYGLYQLILQAPGPAALSLDEGLLMEGSGELSAEVMLAKGNHVLRLRAVGAEGNFGLSWHPPGGNREPIPSYTLYVPPVTNNGLLGRYYPNGNWKEPEAFSQIDPELDLFFHEPLLPRPYTVEWSGKIYIAQTGRYHFGLESIDESMLIINGREILASLEPNQYREGAVSLTEGFHDIQVRFADRTAHTHINFYWVPPGGEQQHVPTRVLFPPQGSYAHISAKVRQDNLNNYLQGEFARLDSTCQMRLRVFRSSSVEVSYP